MSAAFGVQLWRKAFACAALSTVLALAGCASDDYGGGGVSTSVSVGYGGYYGPGWYGGYYEPYPPVVVVPPGDYPDRPDRPGDGSGANRPSTLPADAGGASTRPSTRTAPTASSARPSTAPSRPSSASRPTTRPSPRPAPRPMPRGRR
jgi:hypothetical protein